MHDVVAAPVARQVPEHAGAEAQRRRDPSPPVRVQRHSRTHGDHLDAGDVGLLAGLPLAQRQVGHLVPVGREPLGEVAIPALGAADGVGEQAVVDQADAHAVQHPRRQLDSGARHSRNPVARRASEPPDPPVSTLEQTPSVGSHDVGPLVSVVIPCLNEEENVERCVREAIAALESAGLLGEVIVVDNDSDDRSAELAAAAGARGRTSRRRGYGSAYLAGFAAARGALHRDGRRRPHLRLPRDPQLRRASSRRAPSW